MLNYFHSKTTGTRRKLIIKKCDPNVDRGHYVCRCGVSTTTASMGVKAALKFVHPLEASIEGVEETDFELCVEVTKPSIRSKWLRNGRVLNPNEDKYAGRYAVLTDGCFHKLLIKNLNLKDAAEFVVQVGDELTSKTNFSVKECEKLPRIDMSKVPKVIKIKAGKELNIEVC